MDGHWLMTSVVLALATGMTAGAARADIFTWVDKDGITNVSNEAPPEGVRVSKVVRTAPKDPAREAAARQAEVRALHARVDELSKEVEQSRNDALPPPYAAPPAMAFVPPAPPAPTVVVTVFNQPAQQPEVAPAAGCDYTFGGCGVGFFPGYAYYLPASQRGFHRPHRKWSGAPMPSPTRAGALIPPLIPYPAAPMGVGGRRLG
jgi:hypothetical protein